MRAPWLTVPVAVLMTGSFTSSLAVFLAAPYLATYLSGDLGLSAAAVGLLLGMSYWTLRGSGLVAGPLAARFGLRRVMLYGGAVRIPGYALLCTGHLSGVALGLVLIGLGGGLYFPPSKALLLRLVAPEHQLKALSVRNMLANSGVALGPLIGAAAVHLVDPAVLFGAAAGMFVVLAGLVFALPDVPAAEASAVSGATSRARLLTGPWLSVMVVSAGIGALLIQFESTVPLRLSMADLATLTGVLFTTNAVTVVVAQQPVLKFVAARSSAASLRFGFGLFGAGLATFAVGSAQLPVFVAGTVLLSIGEVFLALVLDDRVRRLPSRDVTSAYAVSGVADAFAGLAGGVLGGLLLDQSSGGGTAPSLLILGAAVAALGLAAATAQRRLDHPRLDHPGLDHPRGDHALPSRSCTSFTADPAPVGEPAPAAPPFPEALPTQPCPADTPEAVR